MIGDKTPAAEIIDYTELAKTVDAFREAVNALVAGLVSDGFTDREARGLVAGFWASRIEGAQNEQG